MAKNAETQQKMLTIWKCLPGKAIVVIVHRWLRVGLHCELRLLPMRRDDKNGSGFHSDLLRDCLNSDGFPHVIDRQYTQKLKYPCTRHCDRRMMTPAPCAQRHVVSAHLQCCFKLASVARHESLHPGPRATSMCDCICR
jgi:hypothetical protein